MANKIREDLTKRLKEAQESLSNSKEIGVKKLEQLSDELKRSFDRAINSLDFKINIFNELKIQRDNLKTWKISSIKTFFPINFKYVLSMPFIYGMFIPGLFFHLCLEIYHQVCFRLYGIPRVKAGDYFIYDRKLLPYLNWIEKLNCFYCSYFNNLLRYAIEISGRTERYWCPIKYATKVNQTHSQYDKFADYLDAKSFREKWKDLRDFSDIKQCEENNCDFKKKIN
jgi:hypothetical protein